MPLELSKVHTFKLMDGAERLVGTNYYKRFEHADVERDLEGRKLYVNQQAFIAQGGHWYDGGGADTDESDLPDWLWEACRAMDKADRLMYRIILPEERAEGKSVPTIEEADEWPTRRMILEALMSLDPKKDEHWTKEGLPSLVEIRHILGTKVPRPRIDLVSPNFVRPGT